MAKIKKIEGFKGYFVTNSGKVLSEYKGNFKWLKPNKQGLIQLYTNGKCKLMLVHRLVAMAFVPIPIKYADMSVDELEVHHADFNHSNNLTSNLMWLSKSEHKKLHSESEVTKKRLSEALKGKHHSEEHKQRISEALKGKPNLALSKPVFQFTKEGEFIAEYASTNEASRQTKVNQGSICECCNGNRNSAGGCIWKFAS